MSGDKGGTTPNTSPRSDLLREAAEIITADRNITHGEPVENFHNIAALWTVLLTDKLRREITPGEVAMMMAATKLARMMAQHTRDHWLDLAGYAGCGYECDRSDGWIRE